MGDMDRGRESGSMLPAPGFSHGMNINGTENAKQQAIGEMHSTRTHDEIAAGVVNKIESQVNNHFHVSGRAGMVGLSPFLSASKSLTMEPTCDDMINWLMRQPSQTPLDPSQHHKSLVRQVTEGTGRWFLTDEKFLDWIDASSSSSRFLWIHGILGSGKTMLLSLAIDLIEAKTESQDDIACAYFYFQEGEEYPASPARIWATMLIQLLRQSKYLADELKMKWDYFRELDGPETLKLLIAQAATFSTVYVVMDALDSCRNAPDEKIEKGVLDAIKAFPSRIRVLFSSRTDWVGQEIGVDQKLSITPTRDDVTAYVKERIKDDGFLESLLVNPQDQDEVVTNVTEMTLAQKMFLLARLHMDNLRKQDPVLGITAALEQLPDSAFKVFETSAKRIAHKVEENGESTLSLLAVHSLTWVVHAKSKLNAQQVLDGFAVRTGHRRPQVDIMTSCNGLVITDPDKETLSLVHKSAQMHLETYNIIPKTAHLEIAKTCLLYLNSRDPSPCDHRQEGKPPADTLTLLQYAAEHWWEHLILAGPDGVDQDARSLTHLFLKDSSKLARAFGAMDRTKLGVFDGMTGLHAAAHFDLPPKPLLERLIDMKVMDVNAKCSDGQTALHWAVRYGRVDLLRLLIDKEADPNMRDEAGDTALHKALLGPTGGDVPLHKAIMRSADDDDGVAEALIKGRARLDILNSRRRSPLSLAICYGPTSVAMLMVESQDDINAEIFDGYWTSLRHIFYHGQDIVQQLNTNNAASLDSKRSVQLRHMVKRHARLLTDSLLRRGVDLNRPSAVDGWTPLMHAAKTGDLSKLRRLLAREPNPADVHLQSQEGKPPLWGAVFHKKTSAVRLLTEHGARVNDRYNDGSTPLITAIENKDCETAELLLRLGADANAGTAGGKSTPLIKSVKIRDRGTVWLLLNAKQIRLDDCDATGWSALLHAVKNRDRDLVWLLLVKGASATSKVRDNRTSAGKPTPSPLELAITCDDFHTAWLLCEHGAVPTVANHDGSTSLHRAVLSGRDDIVAMLATYASPSSSLDTPDARGGNTALALATLQQRPAAVEALLRHGASPSVTDAQGLTALHHAARLGFDKGLGLLLSAGADPNVTDKMGFTPLHHAVNDPYATPDTVGVLVKRAANLEARDRNSRTPLMLAAQLGRANLARRLLAEGADAQARDRNGAKAANYAGEDASMKTVLREWYYEYM
ncbi:ankyrin repeat-containing domain protein [Chaetomium fimeti]|uniref:Ankyrin repeat-containing domain protein n=1 Tax=Chaetomium fimeti TaxID=1854472 RepID=A0AAE0LQV1_9PEZI|nr:ankyrin repeat-containing domain protein [Chaetomium fimeti]